jgi:hypothetical protein
MGSYPRSLSSSGLRLLLRLLSVVAALFVLSVSGRAAAATGQLPSDAAVPMCGEHNDSVEAPPIFRGVGRSALRALPCHAPDQLGVGQSAPSAPKPVLVFERPERVVAFGSLRIAESASSRISIASASRSLERPGFVGTPFRPPRA